MEFKRGAEYGSQRQIAIPVFKIVRIRSCTITFQKMSHICRPNLFTRACMHEKCFAPKFANKCPKFAGPIYFHAHVWVKNVSHQNLSKKSQICRPNSFPRICMWKKCFAPKALPKVASSRIFEIHTSKVRYCSGQ